jgi:hypothetical protein
MILRYRYSVSSSYSTVPIQLASSLRYLNVVVHSVVDPDPHYFGNLDPDPYQIKIRIRIRIRIKIYKLDPEPDLHQFADVKPKLWYGR